jgi:hypothetical protein
MDQTHAEILMLGAVETEGRAYPCGTLNRLESRKVPSTLRFDFPWGTDRRLARTLAGRSEGTANHVASANRSRQCSTNFLPCHAKFPSISAGSDLAAGFSSWLTWT